MNGLRQVSHRVPDTHHVVHCLTNTHKHNMFTLIQQTLSHGYGVCGKTCSNLVETLPVGHFGVRERHPAQKSLTHTSTHRPSGGVILCLFRRFRWRYNITYLVGGGISWAKVVTGMLLMLRSEDCRVLRASEFRGDVKKRITSCLLCNTAKSCVGRRNHWLKRRGTHQHF